MEGKISASMMCANLVDLSSTIKIFEEKNVDFLHIDVMDGEFVPNFGLGVDYIRGLRELTCIPLDIHMMVNNPERKYSFLGLKKSDMVSIHYESTPQVQRAIDILKSYECKCYLAINPSTPIWVLEEVLDYIDGVNLLMVNPGFAGQKVVPSTLHKAEKLHEFLIERNKGNISIEVDGNITIENAKLLKSRGANIFVAGTSSIFSGDKTQYQGNIDKLKAAIK